MFWFGFMLGLLGGGGGYWLYDRYFSRVYSLGKNLLQRTNGDIAAAKAHINMFRKTF